MTTRITADIYDFGSDINGNPTAHFTIWQDGRAIYKSKRRRQTGYIDGYSDGALVKARELTGLADLEVGSVRGDRGEGRINVTFRSSTNRFTQVFTPQTDRYHQFFLDAEAPGWLALADHSGDTPDRTDDGVLYVDFSRRLEQRRGVVMMPIMSPHGVQFSTPIDPLEAVVVNNLANKHRLKGSFHIVPDLIGELA